MVDQSSASMSCIAAGSLFKLAADHRRSISSRLCSTPPPPFFSEAFLSAWANVNVESRNISVRKHKSLFIIQPPNDLTLRLSSGLNRWRVNRRTMQLLRKGLIGPDVVLDNDRQSTQRRSSSNASKDSAIVENDAGR